MIRFSTINVEGHAHIDRVNAFLQEQKPQVLCLQEAFEDDAQAWAQLLKADLIYAPLALATQKDQERKGHTGLWGIAILSTLPVLESSITYYKGTDQIIPEFGWEFGSANDINRALIVTKTQTPEGEISIATTHFTWSNNGDTNEEQAKDFQALTRVLDATQPDLLCGDFNSPRGKGTFFDTLSQRYTDNIPPEVTTTIDGSLHRAGQLELVVDGIFTTPKLQARNVQIHTGVSDHCAVSAELHLN